MTTPNPPINPFVVEGNGELTAMSIRQGLQMLWENTQNEIEGGLYASEPTSYPPTPDHLFGLQLVLKGLQDAADYLSHLEAVPGAPLKEVSNG
ncbi:MAG: hypothetical protein RIC89_22205 [Pseudomonadales bacterium]